jgi:hypothetical protein
MLFRILCFHTGHLRQHVYPYFILACSHLRGTVPGPDRALQRQLFWRAFSATQAIKGGRKDGRRASPRASPQRRQAGHSRAAFAPHLGVPASAALSCFRRRPVWARLCGGINRTASATANRSATASQCNYQCTYQCYCRCDNRQPTMGAGAARARRVASWVVLFGYFKTNK